MSLLQTLRTVLSQDFYHGEIKEGYSAVLIPIREDASEIFLTLARRAGALQHHAGEVGFPGGRYEKGIDRNLIDTALREAQEELGIPPLSVSIAGALNPVITAVTGFTIFPFVGVIPLDTKFVPDPSEVEKVIHVPLSFLLREGALEYFEIELGRGEVIKNYRFSYDGEIIWGATARIIKQFLNVAGDALRGYMRRRVRKRKNEL